MQIGKLLRVHTRFGPRELTEDIQWADFSPGGSQLAVIRDLGPKARLEYPIGKSLFEYTGWLSHLRVSPRGDRMAIVEHPAYNYDSGVNARRSPRLKPRSLIQIQ